MIVGTAGHIDHGKTSLLKALTGTDADRLPEEKARGITVDIGFAYQHFDGGASISFLDVPGHEKLIHNMLAGAAGIDFALLVVAADDGVMPQTREHAAALDLIGVKHGLVALTKTDRAGAGRIGEVTAEIAALLHGTGLQSAPVLPCSPVDGSGIADISAYIADAAHHLAQRPARGNFRLAIDRSFTLQGIGIVVTGTVYSGVVKVGDTLVHSPTGAEVRVRGIRAENRDAAIAVAGQRAALNLTGRRLERDQLTRGGWILAAPAHAPAQRLDVRLRVLASELRPVRQGTPVHVHHGASDVTGRVSSLEDKAIDPGHSAFAQLVLDTPVCAAYGDRFVIRDQSALRTIGGGHIIDPSPPSRGARTPHRLSLLAAADRPEPASALEAMLAVSPTGVDRKPFHAARNLTGEEASAVEAATGVTRVQSGPVDAYLSILAWEALKSEAVGQIAEYQRTHADSAGATIEDIARTFKEPRRKLIAREAIGAVIGSGHVVRYGQLVHLPGHEIKLSHTEEAMWLQIADALLASGNDQPRLAVLAEKLELAPDVLVPVLSKLAQAGRLRRVSKVYFMLPEVVTKLAFDAQRVAQAHETQLLTVGNFRDATNVSRHMVMPLLEYFDRIGVTRRIKDGRQIRPDWSG